MKLVRNSLFALVTLFVIGGCASKGGSGMESSSARKDLEEKYEKKVGKATKEDLVQEFGPASWCRKSDVDDTEKCRFYKKLATKWTGEKTDRVHRETYDEVIADFDAKGVLRSFEAAAQR